MTYLLIVWVVFTYADPGLQHVRAASTFELEFQSYEDCTRAMKDLDRDLASRPRFVQSKLECKGETDDHF